MTKFARGKSGNPDGRPKGVPNRVTMAARERIAAGEDPIAFLQKVMAGDIIQGPGEDNTIVPTVEQRIRAAVVLANKLAPDARDTPVKFRVPKIGNLDDALKAMALALAATALAHGYAPI